MGGTSHFGPTGFGHDDIQSAMKELLRWRPACKASGMWESQAGKMLKGHAGRITYVEQLLFDSCYDPLDKLQRKLGRMGNTFKGKLLFFPSGSSEDECRKKTRCR